MTTILEDAANLKALCDEFKPIDGAELIYQALKPRRWKAWWGDANDAEWATTLPGTYPTREEAEAAAREAAYGCRGGVSAGAYPVEDV